MAYQGPNFTDSTTPLAAAILNALVIAQVSYLQSGSVPTSGTSVNPPVVTQPSMMYVINSGVSASWHSLGPTVLTLPTVSVAQDVYCDVDDTGTFSFQHGAPGFTPAPPAANALRLWKVTTGTSNVGVVLPFLDLANRSPLGANSFMSVDGSNALAVNFPQTLSVAGETTLSGGAIVSGGILRFVSQPPIVLTKGTGLSSSTVISIARGGSQNGNIAVQVLTSNSNPALPVCKVTLANAGFTPFGAIVYGQPGIVAYADVPALSGGLWSFNIFTTTALTTTTSIYQLMYEVLYQ